MDKTQSNEIRNMSIFLVVVVVITFLIWATLEVVSNKSGDEGNKSSPAETSELSSNLATEQASAQGSEESEEVPLIGESFEVYKFKDPFAPMMLSVAPPESIKRTTKPTTGDDNKEGDEETDKTKESVQSSSNTALSTDNTPEVMQVFVSGGKARATLKINNKVVEVTEGQRINNLKIIDIDTTNKAVEFLEGDQKIVVIASG